MGHQRTCSANIKETSLTFRRETLSFCVFQQILSQPEEVTSMNGMKLPLKCSVDYISFSAHVDYRQVSEFVRALQPPHLVSKVPLSLFYSLLPVITVVADQRDGQRFKIQPNAPFRNLFPSIFSSASLIVKKLNNTIPGIFNIYVFLIFLHTD